MALLDTSNKIYANYDYSDVASGAGYSYYYLIDDSEGISLIPFITGAWLGYIENDSTSKDFDLLLNNTKTLRGNAYLSMAVDPSFDTAVTVALYKWDGTTETLIGTSSAKTIVSTDKTTHGFRIPISETTIPKGQYIRLKITSNQNNLYILSQPTANNVTTPNGARTETQSKLALPYKIII